MFYKGNVVGSGVKATQVQLFWNRVLEWVTKAQHLDGAKGSMPFRELTPCQDGTDGASTWLLPCVCRSYGETETRGVSKVSKVSESQAVTDTDTWSQQQVQQKHDNERWLGPSRKLVRLRVELMSTSTSEAAQPAQANVMQQRERVESAFERARVRPYVHVGESAASMAPREGYLV